MKRLEELVGGQGKNIVRLKKNSEEGCLVSE